MGFFALAPGITLQATAFLQRLGLKFPSLYELTLERNGRIVEQIVPSFLQFI